MAQFKCHCCPIDGVRHATAVQKGNDSGYIKDKSDSLVLILTLLGPAHLMRQTSMTKHEPLTFKFRVSRSRLCTSNTELCMSHDFRVSSQVITSESRVESESYRGWDSSRVASHYTRNLKHIFTYLLVSSAIINEQSKILHFFVQVA